MSVGDTITIGTGSSMETRKIASLGTAAANHTTLWQPLPEGPVITIPAGSTNVPVESASGFVAGQKIALGYGSTYPIAANTVEQYEIATVTAVGKPGTQAYLAMDAPAGASNIKVTSLSDISIGDKIRLDIDSVGHGIETVTVANVGTAASQTNLSAPASAGANRISVRRAEGFAAGDRIAVGTPASQEDSYRHSRGQPGAGRYRHRLYTRPRQSLMWSVNGWYLRARAWIWQLPYDSIMRPISRSAIAGQESAFSRRLPLPIRATSPSRPSAPA